MILGNFLVSLVTKKHNSISLSTTEVKYIDATTRCTQIPWMKKTLKDIKVELNDHIPIMCDNMSAIIIDKNLVMH